MSVLTPSRDAFDNRLKAEQIETLFENVTIGVLGASGASLVLAGGLIHLGAPEWRSLILWAGSIILLAIAHIALRLGYLRVPDRATRWRAWAAAFTALAFAEGLGWGYASVALAAGSGFDLQLLVFVVCFGVAAGSIPTFGSFLPAFAALFYTATVPLLIQSLKTLGSSPTASIFLMLIIVFITAMGGLGARANRTIRDMIGLRLHADDLAEALREQKDLAEQANIAKSTFLAAASHDLRQPVHALGLFVGALRGIRLPAEGLRLVEQIEASTAALDSLFSAILDISRLDAGVVDARQATFAIHPLLDRICRDYDQEAKSKAIRLKLIPSTAIVVTDGALMERILRNFVANAVRYTQRGRVVVGCRRIAGSVRIEVWDTGPGIDARYHSNIFQEYFQLENPERDRAKGLGLGLAIVRRLSQLLDCPVILRSQPGRGSCFAITIAAAAPGFRPVEERVETAAYDAGRKLIVVVDDESAIRDAMFALLSSWGYDVISAGSGDEVLDLLAESPVTPDLLICDYRLRVEENGIDVVERLRSEYNETIPAMLITGDTAPDRLIQAQQSGLLLLHKPVPNGKLRAAIANLIAAREADREATIENLETVR